jgi:hypothetical protein
MNNPRRANCSVCGFRHNLRKRDGLIGRHKVYLGSEGFTCKGSGKPDKSVIEIDRILAPKGN